ncbi:porin [Paraburkholderia lycopersici]|uniref:Outer membrane protein (Porin) n=1 Tax=Paraburkholderia lycopersici TaxID=416944 RepID=A0A1G6LXL9_9BURK|nr:porin [Paraburkholderia lycopersici]SDC47971.1 Outer membrane protein (porin) [Paraburkholderia lycopersici]
MKAKLAVAATLLGVSAGAMAQSSVTLFGALDEALVYANNAGGGATVQMLDSYHWNTMWGLEGTEDLGGGLKANFYLANYFNLSNGQNFNSGSFFYGGAWVGLSKQEYGSVTLGRHYDYSVYLLSNMPGVNATLAQTPGNLDHTGGGYLNNAITYTSPTFGGVTFSGLYAFPGGTSDPFATGRAFSLSLTYRGSSFRAAAVATKINGAYVTPTLAGMNMFLGQDVIPYVKVHVDSQNIYGIAASYDLTSKFTLQASYTDVAFAGFNQYQSVRTATASAVYSFAPDLKLTGAYQHSGLGSGDMNSYSLFLDYFLSKRTDVYTAVHYAQSGGATQSATLFTLAPSTTSHQVAVAAGIRHFF